MAGLAVETGIATCNGVAIYYRDIGPRVEPVILLHGFPETGDAFASAVAALGKRYRLIVPDLRGAGLSQRPASGYEKKTLATDVKELMDQLRIDRAHVIGHDIGARVAYAFAVQYPERLLSLTVAEAFIEGLAGTAEFKRVRTDQSADAALRALRTGRRSPGRVPRQGGGTDSFLHELALEEPQVRRRRCHALYRVPQA